MVKLNIVKGFSFPFFFIHKPNKIGQANTKNNIRGFPFSRFKMLMIQSASNCLIMLYNK